MPPMFRFLARHAALGFALATGFVAALVLTDAAGLGRLLTATHEHPLPLALLWFFSGLTFAGAQMAAGIMLLGAADPAPTRPGRLVPIRVTVPARRR